MKSAARQSIVLDIVSASLGVFSAFMGSVWFAVFVWVGAVANFWRAYRAQRAQDLAA